MANRTKRWQVALIGLVMVIYSAVLLRNLHESERRSLQLKDAPIAGDYVGVALRIVEVNPTTSEMTGRVSFRLEGAIAKDPATPAVDLKLLLNEIRGSQQIDLPRGRRINAIEAVFSLDGNVNQYPFDRYETSIWVMVTRKARTSRPSGPQAGKHKEEIPLQETVGGLVVAASQESEPLPIVSSIDASIPGLKFRGQSVQYTGQGIQGFKLVVQRADNVIVVSILIMVLMMSLAMSVLLMSLQALTAPGGKIDLLPLSLCVSLLFGLPALRNAQPSVPALGAFGDYLSFLWAEQLVAVSAVILIWTWLIQQRRTM